MFFMSLIQSDTFDRERDEIFSLLIYALVYQDWQEESIPHPQRRGYNIGALLVTPQHEPVYFGLNCINSTENATQHGEVRAITQYLDATRNFNLEKFTIYTTLEPCVMCAGMITMMAVDQVVYGQHDVAYSKAFERLALDTSSIGGFTPYPRQVLAMPTTLPYCNQLDEAYQEFLATDSEKILAKFLTSNAAKTIFKQALIAFEHYEVKYTENQPVFEKAYQFYHQNIQQ